MKLTRSVSYAVGVLLQIQTLDGDGPVTAARIARGCRFPPRFLYRVLRRLVDAELLRGTSGPGGGYSLARSPRQITMFDVVTAVESTLEPTVLTAVCAKQRPAIARLNEVCRQGAERFADELKQLSLQELVAPPRANRRKRRRGKSKAGK
jgi:Rrf2 family protein